MSVSASLPGFIAASLLVLLIPGPGVLYVVARSLAQGQRAGMVSVLGLATGALAQVIAAALGVSALLLASASAFGVVKLLGAGYLIYLGLNALLSPCPSQVVGDLTPHSLYRLFRDGVVVSLLNPKIAVFFLAFLPQFVDPERGPVAPQILFLGILYVCLALFTDGAYALLAGRLRGWLGKRFIRGPAPQYASGVVYLGLGVATALAERR